MGYFFGLSQTEIARALALPLGTVKKRVRLGLQKLRVALDVRGAAPRLRVVVDE
ncbi:MAG TPA: sigma factor-like helix-turn-helix DNA-binding protein [Candidatus Limnocylindria bacterium]|nr:sigma factor-like helix-turn-helix DNA-binding protein [Candidatus Limnocylindria bacterium]